MKKKIAILALTGVFIAGSALASGWRIPEQSVNSTALSAAYVANAHGPDAAYFNPANMTFETDKESWQLEIDAMYIHLTSVEYTDSRTSTMDGDSKKENFLLPQFHLVSPEFSNMRFGLSFTVPGGLSKRWDDNYQEASAGEFTLEVLELNPTLAYRLHDKVSVAAGVRLVHSSGRVSSTAVAPYGGGLDSLSRELEDGESNDFGYNLALTVKPMDNLTTAITWRSKVDLTLKSDDVTLQSTHWSTLPDLNRLYTGDGNVTVPLPEVLTVAVAYTIKATTIEVVWDRTFWSDYDELDFDYDQDFTTTTGFSNFDNPIAKDYNDADAYRIGVSHKMLKDRLTLMAGFAIDETPVPDHSLGFELPDSKAKMYSAGLRYQLNDQYELALAYLYSDKEEREIKSDDGNTIVGEFKNAAAHMVTTGLTMKF